MKRFYTLIGIALSLAMATLIIGCGGSSTTDTAITTTDSLSKISGTVPGTLIEAFCADGSYYKVNSTDNNTDEHPFEIEIPSTVGCSLIMTTNENDNASRIVTQIGITASGVNGTLFRAATDTNLGYIPLEMDYGKVADANGDHVSDDILSIQVDGTSIVVDKLENPLDDDDDGLVNVYEDYDDDGISNYYDDDDDDDGILDIDENDNDLDDDGVDNDNDVDDDNDGLDDNVDSDDNTTTDILLPTTYKADAGRLLGSQCAQCHGTNGVSSNEWDSIAGEDNLLDEIYQDEEPIMNAQAHGYTQEEIILIGNWLKTLKTND